MLLKKTWLKLRHGSPVILVSGLPRSGTSMLMQMLDAGGCPVVTDHERTPDHDNPKGYFELEKVKTLDKKGDKSWLKQHRGEAIKIISFLLRDLPLDVNYKVIFMLRDLNEVLSSQNKMLDRLGQTEDDTPDSKMVENYRNHLIRVKYFLKHTANFDTLYVDHRGILSSPENWAQKITQFLDPSMNVDAMAAIVDPNLYRNRG